MNYIKDIKLKEKGGYNVIVEIPKGTNSKWELVDKDFNKVIEVRKVGRKYPFYYGCVPQTYAGDRDPLDMILLTKKKRNILDIVNVQPIAVIKTIDNGEQDDKVICIDSEEEISNLPKLEKKVLKFLHSYKGKKNNTQIDDTIYPVNTALDLIEQAHNSYLSNRAINSLKSISITF